MKIALNEKQGRVIVLDQVGLRLFDISGETPQPVAAYELNDGWWLASCDGYVGVLTGKLAPAGASVKKAKLVRFHWDLSKIDESALGEVEKRGIALSADGGRVAFPDWATCEIVIADAATGKRVSGNGEGIPSGPSWSPDGRHVIAGSADQGSGAILLFDVTPTADLPMTQLPEGDPSPGLDDAPYFSVFSASGKLTALSNESWGGRGVFLYDVDAQRPVWSKVLESASEETDDWYPYALAFAVSDALLLSSCPGSIQAYRTRDGHDLGAVAVGGDGRGGFVVEHARRKLWLPGEEPTAYPFPDTWLA